MRPADRRDSSPRRACRPSLEGLEGRDLLSVASPLARTSPVNPALIPGFLQTMYGPVTTTQPITINGQVFPPGTYTTPQPTASEIKRESFVEKFIGRYTIGPPRFSNQAATIHIVSNGRNAGSNQFLHARSQLILFTPADPTAKPTTNDPTAGQITGLISAFPANFLQSSNNAFMDVTNLSGVASNDPSTLDHGLPSRLAWFWDPVSGGIYSSPQFTTTPSVQTDPITGATVPLNEQSLGPVANFQGTGQLDIKYLPDRRPQPGTSGSGVAIVTIQGLFNTTGATYALAKAIN
jgi:hypothetical protein